MLARGQPWVGDSSARRCFRRGHVAIPGHDVRGSRGGDQRIAFVLPLGFAFSVNQSRNSV